MTTYQSKRDELVVELFESGRDIDKQWQKYDGDLDFNDWLKEVLPKIPGFYDSLDQLVQTEVRKARIDELESIPRTRSKQAYIENRLAQLNKEKKDE